MTNFRLTLVIARTMTWLMVAFAATSLAVAQSQQEPPDDPDAPQDVNPDLSGPEVEPEAEEGEPFPTGGPRDQRRRGTMPAFMWINIINEMDLSEDQAAPLQGVIREFQEAQRDFQQKYGQEMRELGQQFRESRQAGEPPNPELQKKMQELRGKSPNSEEYQKRVWAMLTVEQQEMFQERLTEVRGEMEGRRRGRAQDQSQPDGPMDEMYEGRRSPGAQSNRLELDDMGRRRLQFLMSRQSATRRGAGPSPRERRFDFDENRRRPGVDPESGLAKEPYPATDD